MPRFQATTPFFNLFYVASVYVALTLSNHASAQTPIDRGVDFTSGSLFSIRGNEDANELGHWSEAASWPINGIHAALLPNGEVITYGANPLQAGTGFVYDLWNPSRGLRPAAHEAAKALRFQSRTAKRLW